MSLNAAFAKGESAQTSDEMRFLVERSQHFARISDGLFNPAIGKLIALWGFHSDTFAPVVPDNIAVKRLVDARPSVLNLTISGNEIRSANPAVELDLGGIAKGYALDRAAALLHQRGIHDALINIGGNIMALGSKGKTPWTVGIQHPRASGPLATLTLYDGEAIGTSGDYQRFFEVGNKRYSHLIDPRSGFPAAHTEAVTVLITPQANAGLLSDVTSKPIFLGGNQWREMAKRCGVNEVLRVDANGKIAVTTALRARLRWEGDARPDEVVE
jgi:FAD:protein FMN transferase